MSSSSLGIVNFRIFPILYNVFFTYGNDSPAEATKIFCNFVFLLMLIIFSKATSITKINFASA